MQFLLAAAFFASGATALVYQIVWLKSFCIVFGNTTHAAATVVSAFMGGLALGSYLAGKVIDRSARLLRLYGLIEVGIAVSAWCVPHALRLCDPMIAAMYRQGDHSRVALTVLRVVLAGVVLLIPTVLMGSTLAVVSKLSVRRAEDVGSTVAALYGLNTLGAVVGCCSAGFLLIRVLGMKQTLALGCVVNGVLGVLVVLIDAKAATHGWKDERAYEPVAGLHRSGEASRTRTIAFIVLFVSGFTSLSYEVLWMRLLDFVMIRASSVFSFTLVVATFLIGSALGSAISSARLSRLDAPIRVLARLQLVLGVSVPTCGVLLARWKASAPAGAGHDLLAAVILVLPPATVLGMGLPLACGLASSGVATLGRSLGTAYAINILGCVVGPLVTGFAAIPILGANGSLSAVAAVNAATSIGLFATEPRQERSISRIFFAVALALAAVRWGSKQHLVAALLGRPRESLVFFREDSASTVIAYVDDHQDIQLNLGGTWGQGTSPRLLEGNEINAYVPLLLHPSPRQIAVVGFGTGRTTALYADHPLVRQVEVVEISEGVLEAGRTVFAAANHSVLSNRKVHVVVDDGFNFIKYVPRSYDVISVDTFGPWALGTASLYTREFWQNCLAKLNTHGVVITESFTKHTDERALKVLLKTFQSVFDHSTVLATLQGQYVVFLGGRDPLTINLQQIRDRLTTRPDLGSFPTFITNEHTFLSYFVAGERQIREFAADERELNTLDRPIAQFSIRNMAELNNGIERLRTAVGARAWDFR